MKSLLAVMVAISLAATPAPVAAGQSTAPPPRGPISRAITPEAVRLAMGPALSEPRKTGEQASPGWSKVRRLKPGTEIIVTVAGGAPPLTGHAVLIDDTGLTVLYLRDPGLTPDARRELLAVASDHPERLSHDRPHVVGTHVRVAPDGVFVADQRVADPGQIVKRIVRDDVRTIVRPVRRRGSKWGAVGGAAVGLYLGFGTALSLSLTSCGRSCRDEEALAWGAFIGLPIAGGFLGYHGFARHTAEVIYRVR
jgi:hypothetical protein